MPEGGFVHLKGSDRAILDAGCWLVCHSRQAEFRSTVCLPCRLLEICPCNRSAFEPDKRFNFKKIIIYK